MILTKVKRNDVFSSFDHEGRCDFIVFDTTNSDKAVA